MGRYRRDLDMAQQRLIHPPALLSVVGGVEYLQVGTGPPVLVLHGNNGGWDQAVDWAGRRIPAGFGVIAVSRYGYLGSALPADATTAGQADDLARLLDHLGHDRVDVVSLSAGSTAAVRLALRHPDRVRRLVLESPVLPAVRPLRLPPTPALRLLLRTEWPTWLTSTRPEIVARAGGVAWKKLDTDARHELRQIMETLLPVRSRRAGMLFDNAVTAPEMLRDELAWEQLAAPTLVLTAEDSPLPKPADAEAIARRLPQGRLEVQPSGGHLLLGNVPRLQALLRDFLR
ncbi:alpha/beta hydrolase [Kineosporia sp. NBRC 101731]|uniref:alpha/beta fold hydrolase n=1 Tax=Kineosporia sp. NBRC 101731 TaxID=3032199 RepID=UPI00249FECAF|nr:alpha/beta hydrolase [Kineosporia sp. NBRC 101731]GLY28198.1 alpha/beta hydrolase [Kineosporia sp. NBRC 101731]